MCALVVNKKGWEKKNRKKAQETASLDKVKEKKGGALAHQEEEEKQNTPPPPSLKENYAWSDGGKLQRKRRTWRAEQEEGAAGRVDGCWWVRTDVERRLQGAG